MRRTSRTGKAAALGKWVFITLLLALVGGGIAVGYPAPVEKATSSKSTVKGWGVSRALEMELEGISNFHWVDHRICRGGQPSKSQFQVLKAAGVDTVVNLREDFKSYEAAEAEAAGLKYVNIAMSSTRYPSDDEVRQIVKAMGTPQSPDKIYVHCAGGKHRTGAAVAVYRILYYGFTFDQAYKEMLDCWFYTIGGHQCVADFVRDFSATHQKTGHPELLALNRPAATPPASEPSPAPVETLPAEENPAPAVKAGNTPDGTVAATDLPVAAPAAPALATPPQLIHKVEPVMPAFARQAKTEGVVTVELTVNAEGKVSKAKAVKGPKILRSAAVDAVYKWRYRPATLRGQPIESPQTVRVNFSQE